MTNQHVRFRQDMGSEIESIPISLSRAPPCADALSLPRLANSPRPLCSSQSPCKSLESSACVAVTYWSRLLSTDGARTYSLCQSYCTFGCPWQKGRILYRYAPHNDVSVNDGPRIRRWSYNIVIPLCCRSQWPRGLRLRSAAACLLRSWVRIPTGAWMFVVSVVLSGRGLCDQLITRPKKSYRLWCVVVCDLEISRMSRPWPALGRSATAKKNIRILLCYNCLQ